MYPTYELQVYDYLEKKWRQVAHIKPSNRPHYYQECWKEYGRLVATAKDGSPNQQPIGYRIIANGTPIDLWTNGKIA